MCISFFRESTLPVSPGFSSPTHTPLDLNSLEKYPSLRNDILMTQHRQWSNYDSGCLEQLRSYTAKAHSVGVSAEFTQSPGSPSRVICNFACTWAADLIVIGNRGRSGFNEMLLGSVSNAVVHHAPCSVMVVRPRIEANPQGAEPVGLEHTARE